MAAKSASSSVSAPTRAAGRATKSAAPEAASTVFLIKQLELAIRARLEPITKKFAVTPPQYVALSTLSREPGISSAELARRSFVTAQAANELVAALERKGLIDRRADPANHRIRHIHLTRKGTSALASCEADIRKLEQELLSPLGLTKPVALRKSLQSCIDALS